MILKVLQNTSLEKKSKVEDDILQPVYFLCVKVGAFAINNNNHI